MARILLPSGGDGATQDDTVWEVNLGELSSCISIERIRSHKSPKKFGTTLRFKLRIRIIRIGDDWQVVAGCSRQLLQGLI